jgi:peroxiredoxin
MTRMNRAPLLAMAFLLAAPALARAQDTAPVASTVKAGDPAPDFKAKTDEGKEVTLADFKGKRVVLWFFPKADTPG